MAEPDAVRLLVALAQCEITLVRRDAVAGPLLSQAARAADALPAGPLVAAAAGLMRAPAPSVPARKAAQALCRAAIQSVQAELLGTRRR